METQTDGKRTEPTKTMIEVIMNAVGLEATPEKVMALRDNFIRQNQELASIDKEYAASIYERVTPGFDRALRIAQMQQVLGVYPAAYRHLSAA